MLENNKNEVISIRRTDDINNVLNFLKTKLMLNTTSVIRLALVKLYESEKDEENKKRNCMNKEVI